MSSLKGPTWGPKVYQAKSWTGPTGQKLTDQEIQNEYIANGFSSQDTNNHFPFSVFFLDSLEQFHFKGTKWTLDDWYAVFWHEVFHNYQDQLYDQSLISDDVRNFQHVAENAKSEKFLKRIRLEQQDLSKALKTSNPKIKMKILCSRFKSKREDRYKTTSKTAVLAEQFNEISEGTARYVEEKLSAAVGQYLADPKAQEQFRQDGFQYFEKYKDKSVSTYADSILQVSSDNLYFYNSGFALALVLDQVHPNWKETAFKKTGFLYGELTNWCARSQSNKKVTAK